MASCFSSIGVLVLLSNEYPITGRMEGFILATVIFTSGGRLFLTSLIFDSICCWFTSISLLQSMKADISQLPLLVVLRRRTRSGTCLIADSNGLVTVTIILSTG